MNFTNPKAEALFKDLPPQVRGGLMLWALEQEAKLERGEDIGIPEGRMGFVDIKEDGAVIQHGVIDGDGEKNPDWPTEEE